MEPAGVPPVGGDQLAPPGFQTPEQIAQGLTTNAQNPQPGVSRPVGAESQPPGRRQPSLVPGLPNPLPLFTNLLPGPSRPPQLQQPHVQPPFDMPPLVPHGFNGPATLQPVLNGVVIGHTSTGMPWFAVPAMTMPWQVPPRPPASTPANTIGPITLTPEMAQFTTAISEAIRAASPIVQPAGTSATGSASRVPENVLLRSAQGMSVETHNSLPAPPAPSVARALVFDGSPGTVTRRNPSAGSTDNATHQLVVRIDFPLFMTQSTLNAAIGSIASFHAITSVFACLRETDKKNITTVMTSAEPLPQSWQTLQVDRGMNDACISSIMNWLDSPMDMLEILQHAVGGRLIIVIDENLGPDSRKICMQYMRIMQSQLEFGYNPFAVIMNRHVKQQKDALVYIPASILALKDRFCTAKMLAALPDATRRHIEAGYDEDQPITMPHLFLTTLRFAYKPDKDDTRKVRVARVFLDPLQDYKNYDQFHAFWTKIKREYRELKGRDVHAHDPKEERECILLLLSHRSWMQTFKRRWEEKGWPDSTEGLFEKLKIEMMNEASVQEKSRYNARRVNAVLDEESDASSEYDINMLGAKDAKRPKRPASAPPPTSRDKGGGRGRYDGKYDRREQDRDRNRYNRDNDRISHSHRQRDSRSGERRDRDRPRHQNSGSSRGSDKGHTRYTSARDDRKFHPTGNNPPRERLKDERRYVRRYGIEGRSRSLEGTKYLLGPPQQPPEGWKCPHCDRNVCRGRCMICLAEASCNIAHRNNCPQKHARFADAKTWPKDWFNNKQHEPCMRCGHAGHPASACPKRNERRVLMRTQWHEGKHRNALVAFLDLKDGCTAPDDENTHEVDRDTHETILSDGCRDHASCGHAHEYDVNYVHTADTRLAVDTPALESHVYMALSSEYGYEHEYRDEDFERDEACEASNNSESDRSDVYPIYSLDEVTHANMSSSDDASFIATLASHSSIPPDAAVWDSGAMKSVNKDDRNAIEYVKESFAKLYTANGTPMKNVGEACFEMLCDTKQGTPHSMIRNAPICPEAPINIISAGEKYKDGYGSAHNLEGIFISKNTYLYDRVKKIAYRREYLEFEKDEHQVITPELQQIMLHQRKPNLFTIEPMPHTTVEESEHLKDMRANNPKYESISLLRMDDEVRFDKSLEFYTGEAQQLLGKIEQLQRSLAHVSAYDTEVSDALIAAVHCMHNVYDTLHNPDTSARHSEDVRQNIARMHPSALQSVCTRCERPTDASCADRCDGADKCTYACKECGSQDVRKHKEGYTCARRCAASNTILALTEKVREEMLTDTGNAEDDRIHDANMSEHAQLHAQCHKHPCKTCREHADMQQTEHADSSIQSNLIASISDESVARAFASLQLHDNAIVSSVTSMAAPVSDAVPVQSNLNDAGVCVKCWHHWTGCRCTDALSGKYKHTKGRCVHKACRRWAAYFGVGKICSACNPARATECDACLVTAYSMLFESKKEDHDRDTDRTSAPSTSHKTSMQHGMDAVRHVSMGEGSGASTSGESGSGQHGMSHAQPSNVTDNIMHSNLHHATMPVLTRARRTPPKTVGNATVGQSGVGNAATSTSGVGNATASTSGVGNAATSIDAVGHATVSMDDGNASSEMDSVGHATEREVGKATSASSSRKRKGEEASIDRHTMLSVIGRHAWQSVLENASSYPTVLSFTPLEWLEQLPLDMRNILSVVHQNTVTANCKHELCMSKHGKNSAKTLEAATNRAKEQRTYDDTVALLARIAETMLAAGTAK